MRNSTSALLPALLLIAFTAHAQTYQWNSQVGGTLLDMALAVDIDPSGNVITAGTFVGTVDLDPGPGVFNVTTVNSADIWIQKLDPNGAFLWGGVFGSTGSDGAHAVRSDASGNIYLSGYFSGTVDFDIGPGVTSVTSNNTSFDIFVMKLSPSGSLLWVRTIGSASNDRAYGMDLDSIGNVFTTGEIAQTLDLDPGPGVSTVSSAGGKDVFIQKLDASGNFVWGRVFGGPTDDSGFDVAVGKSGSIFITGEFRTSADLDPGPGNFPVTSFGNTDIFVVHLAADATFLWAERFGGNSVENGLGICTDALGNCILTGEVNSVMDVDPGPGTVALNGTAFEDSFVLSLTDGGDFVWATILKAFLNSGTEVTTDAQNNVYAIGRFGGTMDIDPGPGIVNLTNSGGGDIYVISYDPLGALRWGFKLGSQANDAANGIAVDGNGRIAITGAFQGTMDVDPSANTVNITNAGMQDGFTAVYSQAPACDNARVSLRVILDGAYRPNDQLMVDSLRTKGLLPLTEPYTALGFPISGPTTVQPAVLAVSGSNAITDWVVVELRDQNDPTIIVESRVGLLQRDGDVVAPDGVSPLGFCAPDGVYHVAVRHRNHLGIMSATHLPLTSTPTLYDLTLPGTGVFGTEPRKDLGTLFTLWPGNVIPDTVLKYTGATNDRDPILLAVGGTIPTSLASGYLPSDVTLDGQAKYTGAGNDRDPLLISIGGVIVTNTRVQQLP